MTMTTFNAPLALMTFALVAATCAMMVLARALPRTAPHRDSIALGALGVGAFALLSALHLFSGAFGVSLLHGFLFAVAALQVAGGAAGLIALLGNPPASWLRRVWRWSSLTVYTAAAAAVASTVFQNHDPEAVVRWGPATGALLWLINGPEDLIKWLRDRAEARAVERRERQRVWLSFS